MTDKLSPHNAVLILLNETKDLDVCANAVAQLAGLLSNSDLFVMHLAKSGQTDDLFLLLKERVFPQLEQIRYGKKIKSGNQYYCQDLGRFALRQGLFIAPPSLIESHRQSTWMLVQEIIAAYHQSWRGIILGKCPSASQLGMLPYHLLDKMAFYHVDGQVDLALDLLTGFVTPQPLKSFLEPNADGITPALDNWVEDYVPDEKIVDHSLSSATTSLSDIDVEKETKLGPQSYTLEQQPISENQVEEAPQAYLAPHNPLTYSPRSIENRLLDLSERLHLATESAQIGVWEWDLERDRLIWTPLMFHIYGVDADEFRGNFNEWAETLLAADLKEFRDQINLVIKGEAELDHTHRVGEAQDCRYIRCVANRYERDDKKGYRLIGVSWDITESKRAELAILDAKERAEEMGRLKNSFLANMSHEIRTPLNGLLGMCQLAMIEDNLPSIRGMVDVMFESGKRLLGTLTGILELAHMEATQKEFDFQDLNLTKIVEECASYWEISARDKGLEMTWQEPAGDYFVLGDPRMLPLIFNNLIGNAIKFTKEGFVKISLDRVQDRHGEAFVLATIEDSGIGIAEDKLTAIFEAFQQGDSGYNRSHEGTGLGLAIAQKYTRLLGGHIQVESTLDKGSTFSVRLPMRK